MAQRGYEESLIGMRVARELARDPTLSERQAILAVDSNEGNLRRHQGKRLAARKADGVEAQATRHPVSFDDRDGVASFAVSAPGGDERTQTVTVVVTSARARGGRPGVRTSVESRHRDGRSERDEDPAVALRSLGMGPTAHKGALVAMDGPPPVATSLGDALHATWVASGCRDVPGLRAEAVATEWDRLREGGLDALARFVDDGSRRIAACHSGHVGPEVLATAMGPDADRSLRSVLLSMASFAGPETAALATAATREWLGRPVDMLLRILDRTDDGTLARRPDRSDAAWLVETFGHRSVEPLGPEATLLARSRMLIDPSRLETDADAAALARVAKGCHAVARACRCEAAEVMDLTLRRLSAASDRSRGYGEVTAGMDEAPVDGHGLLGLRSAALPPFARSLAALSLGVERLLARVAADLVLPTLALDDRAGATRDGSDEAVVASTLRRIEAVTHDAVTQGRGVDELVRAVTGSRVTEHASDDALPFALTVRGAVDVMRRAQRSGEELDLAWRRHAPSLAPRWRDGGRTAVTDLLSGSWDVIHAREPSGGGIAEGLRRMGVGRRR